MQAIQFLSDPAWQRLALTLLHFLWQGLAVTALAVTLVRLLRLRSGPPRYAAYLLALVVMAVCPVVTLCLVKPPAPMELPAEPQAIEAGTSRGQERPPMDALAPVEGIEADAAPPGAPVALDAPEDGSLPGLTESAEAGEIRTEAPRSALARYISAGLPWVAAAWLIGVCALSTRLLLGLAGTRRWRRRLESLPRHLAEAVAALSERMGLAGFARVFISTFAAQPMVVGYLRPMVLLPAAMLTQLPPDMLEAVIAHELAHIRRLDVWVNLFQRVMETVLFYHPAVWWLSGRLRWEREFCCDELAVAATGERLTYASALERAYRSALGAVQPTPALAAGLGAQKKTVLARVRHVLGLMPSPSRSRWWPAGALGLLSLLAVVIGMGVSAAADKPPATQPATGGSAGRPAGASGELSARAVPVFPISVGERAAGVEAVLIEMLRGRIDPDRARMDHFQIRNPHRKSVDFTSAFRLHVFDDGRRCLLEARITSIRFAKFTAAVILKRGLPLAGGGGLKKDIVLTCPLFSSGTTPPGVGEVDERFRSLIVQAPVSNARLADLVRQHPRVRRIHLHGCRAVTDLSPLGKLPNLADVTMSGCSRLADLSPLRKLNRLARIYLTACRSLKDLSPVAGMAGLTALHLHGCPQLRDITPLAKLDRLAELSLYNFDGIKDITPLARLTNLRYLNISLADHLSDLSPLTAMTGLEVLDAGGLKKLSDISPLAKLKGLRALLLYRTRVKDLSGLAGLTRLEQLTLSGLEDLVDLKPLAGLTGLRFLDLHDCKNLTDLTPLLGLKRLKALNLKGCDRLTRQQMEAIRKVLPQCTITGPAEADGRDEAPAPPATQPMTLPGRPAAELPRLAVHPLAVLCRATSQAHVETLGGGLRATVQHYEPIEAIGRMRIAEKFRIAYLVRPGQRPVRRGERVIWVVASAVAGTFRGLCCFEDTPANRKAAKAILKDPGAEKPPAQLIRPKALLLPGSTVPLVEALRESLFIAVAKAGKDDRGVVMEDGVMLHTHDFEAVKFLRGRGVPGKVTIHYTRFELSTLSVGRERRIKEGEVVLWIVGPTDRQRHWRGIKALPDTPANRRVVLVETRRESQILPYAAAQLLAAFVISEGEKGRRPKGATEMQFLPKFFDGLKAKYPELMLVTPDQEKRFAAGQFDDAANKRRAAAAIKALADLGATLPRFAVFLIGHHRAGKLRGARLEFARRLLEAILAKTRDVSATTQPARGPRTIAEVLARRRLQSWRA